MFVPPKLYTHKGVGRKLFAAGLFNPTPALLCRPNEHVFLHTDFAGSWSRERKRVFDVSLPRQLVVRQLRLRAAFEVRYHPLSIASGARMYTVASGSELVQQVCEICTCMTLVDD